MLLLATVFQQILCNYLKQILSKYQRKTDGCLIGKANFRCARNLVAYACRLSFQKGFDGFVSFHSKTKLIDHYIKTLGAYHFGGHLMIIDILRAKALIEKYFKS